MLIFSICARTELERVQVYYFNTLTGQSEWLKPEFHAELHVGADDEVWIVRNPHWLGSW